MKHWTVWLAVLLLAGAASGAETLLPAEVLARGAEVEKETRVHALAQDATGAIWGISRDNAGEVFLRGDQGWEATAVAAVESLRPQAIDAAADGAVVCLWLSPDGAQGAFSRHRGKEAPSVVTFAGKLREPRLFVCPDGGVIAAERGPTVVLFDAAGKTAQVRTVPDTFLRPATKGDAQERNYAPTRVVQDAAGRRWLWSYALDTRDYQWRIAGLVRMREDGSFENFAIDGLTADDRFSEILPAGPNELWLAKVGDGLWSVNTESQQAAPLPEESFAGVERKAFRYIEEMRTMEGTRYVVSCPRPTQFDAVDENAPRITGRVFLGYRKFYHDNERTGSLFCYREGKWEKQLDKLDDSPRFGGWKRPWAKSADALVIGATGSGPWILPKDATSSPVLLDWQQRFPLIDALDFATTSQGLLLCLSSQGETALTPIRSRHEKRFRTVSLNKIWQRIWRDARGNLWICGVSLQEWNGELWKPHPLPAPVADQEISAWLADDRDRGWVFFESGQVAICEFAAAQWQVFPTVEDALKAQLPAGVRLPNLDDPYLDPAFSGDGRCAVFRLPDRLSYFDGATWRRWTTREIAGEPTQVSGAPYFDNTGKLCFPLGGHVRQWDAPAEKWIAFSDPLGPQPSTRPVEPSVEIPETLLVKDPASVARDTDGNHWVVTRDGELKKYAPGWLVAAFFNGEPHPFRQGMQIARALIDARGGAWLELSGFGPYHRYVYIQAFSPPDTRAELLRSEGDTAILRFTVPIGGAAKKSGSPADYLFSWQLDGGPWQRLTKQPDLTLTHLAPGRHRLLARASGAMLNADPTPAVVEWETRIDPEQQHRALLAELSAPTLARREAAAKAFRDQGAAAASFLQAARPTASDETRWWIDAVLQQIAPKR